MSVTPRQLALVQRHRDDIDSDALPARPAEPRGLLQHRVQRRQQLMRVRPRGGIGAHFDDDYCGCTNPASPHRYKAMPPDEGCSKFVEADESVPDATGFSG